MGDNQNARLAAAIGRLLNQKDRSTLSTVLEDIFPVYLLDDLAAPENTYQQSRDLWWAVGSAVGAAGQNASVQLLNGSPGSLLVVERIMVASVSAAPGVAELRFGGLFAGAGAAAGGVAWADDRNTGAGPPAAQVWTSTAAGAPTGPGFPLQQSVIQTIHGPWVLRSSNAASASLGCRIGSVATSLFVAFFGYERPWEPSDA